MWFLGYPRFFFLTLLLNQIPQKRDRPRIVVLQTMSASAPTKEHAEEPAKEGAGEDGGAQEKQVVSPKPPLSPSSKRNRNSIGKPKTNSPVQTARAYGVSPPQVRPKPDTARPSGASPMIRHLTQQHKNEKKQAHSNQQQQQQQQGRTTADSNKSNRSKRCTNDEAQTKLPPIRGNHSARGSSATSSTRRADEARDGRKLREPVKDPVVASLLEKEVQDILAYSEQRKQSDEPETGNEQTPRSPRTPRSRSSSPKRRKTSPTHSASKNRSHRGASPNGGEGKKGKKEDDGDESGLDDTHRSVEQPEHAAAKPKAPHRPDPTVPRVPPVKFSCSLRETMRLRLRDQDGPLDEFLSDVPPPQVVVPKEKKTWYKEEPESVRLRHGKPKYPQYRVLEWVVPEAHSVIPPAVKPENGFPRERRCYHIIPKAAPGFVMGCGGNDRFNGTPICLWKIDGKRNQKWFPTVTSNDGLAFTFSPYHARGDKFLDNPGEGQQCQLWESQASLWKGKNSPHQHWRLKFVCDGAEDTEKYFMLLKNGHEPPLALQADSIEDGAAFRTAAPNGSDLQLFRFVRV
jgi:hypothetical protein